MESVSQSDNKNHSPNELPFVAPCRDLDLRAPLRWLELGWQDLKSAPRQSLSYGVALFFISHVMSFIALYFGNLYLLIGMLSGFIFVGPVIAIGLYSVSCQLQNGLTPQLGYCLRDGYRHISEELIYAAILLVVFLVWARAAAMVHVFFPVEADPSVKDFAIFLGIGSAVGSLFAAIIFSASAFSLPMIMDKKADMVTAVITSVNAVLRNKKTMLLWAFIIVLSLLVGFMTAFIGLIVLMPLIGHATWHAYQETIDASAWPEHD